MDATNKQRVVSTLAALRTLLGDKSRWTQGTNARDPEGTQVNWDHPDACKFCLNGGLLKVSGHKRGDDYAAHFTLSELMLDRCALSLFSTGYVTVNDGRDHDSVVKVMDCAIKHAQDEPVEA